MPDLDRQNPASEAEKLELQSDLDKLKDNFFEGSGNVDVERINAHVQTGQSIRRSLLDAEPAKDQFRIQNGFQILLSAMEMLLLAPSDAEPSSDHKASCSHYLATLFGILSASIRDHQGNQRFFRKRVNGGGWKVLEGILMKAVISQRTAEYHSAYDLYDRLCGCLLACAVDDETLARLYFRMRATSNREDVSVNEQVLTMASSYALLDETKLPNSEENLERKALLEREIGALTNVQQPEALSLAFELWKLMDIGPPEDRMSAHAGVPASINHIANLSTRNLAALHSTPLLSSVLSCLSSSSLQSPEKRELRRLALNLLKLGVSSIDDAHLLYGTAPTSPFIAQLLLEALRSSHSPSYIHFDLSLHGYSSIELPGIGRGFPPSSSAGYTLTLWLYVVRFDPMSHTTLFGAFDSSQSCFVLMYLEKDTRNLILQTSVSSSRPSVRFKALAFQDKHWYHVAIVHRRPKTTMSSRASLFVNGTFVEQVRSNYPAFPPTVPLSTANKDGPRRPNSIQAFLGTPQDLATRIGRGLVFSEWRLASARLFGEALSDDMIAVHNQLGPRYAGNYQDILGSFQTYQASAELNILNETLHPGKEERSEIVAAIRSKAGILVPESLVLLNFSPNAVLCYDDFETKRSRMFKGLGKQAQTNLQHITRGHHPLAVNGAIANVNEALKHTSGLAVLTGDPVIVELQALDDAAWRIGGCAAVGLSLIEAARTGADLVVALETLLESIKNSWRNSEAMERENGFGVLATLLAKKLDPAGSPPIYDEHRTSSSGIDMMDTDYSLRILSITLDFVGYKAEKPRESIINNPLAYRVLIVDSPLWRNSVPAVQRLYYHQFVVFGSGSKHRHFNLKRLSKMRKR